MLELQLGTPLLIFCAILLPSDFQVCMDVRFAWLHGQNQYCRWHHLHLSVHMMLAGNASARGRMQAYAYDQHDD